VKLKLAELEFDGLVGWLVIDVLGAVVSTVHV
jgi:hypothetical protein